MGKVHIYMEFSTYSQALDFKLRTLMNYDPMAYDTAIRMVRREGKYIVEGLRYASAD
jgi:hypothetical protein